MSGHVPTVLPVQSVTPRTDNSYYVKLSTSGDSPSSPPPAPGDVRTPDVRTRPSLPRAEHRHAPAPAEPQDGALYVPMSAHPDPTSAHREAP